MWRPDDWKCKYLGKKANRYYELGADAMLEAIWEMAKESPTGKFTFDMNTINVYANEEEE